MAGKGTPATALLAKRDVAHTIHTYEHDPREESYGAEAATALGVAAERVFKTLVADVAGSLTVGVVPITSQLDLKALAAAVGGKRAELADTAVAQRATGYVVGGISPLGQRNRLPVVVDVSAQRFDTIFCSGGRRGLEIEIRANDLIALVDAGVAPIAR